TPPSTPSTTPPPAVPVAQPAPKKSAASSTGWRLSFDDLATLNRELVELVEAGAPLPAGLAACARDLKRNRLAAVMEELRIDLEAGLPLSKAMAGRGPALPPIYHALVAAGA